MMNNVKCVLVDTRGQESGVELEYFVLPFLRLASLKQQGKC